MVSSASWRLPAWSGGAQRGRRPRVGPSLVRPRRRATVLVLDIAVDSIGAAPGRPGRPSDRRRAGGPRSRHLAAERIATDLARLALPLVERHGARDSLIGIGVAMVGVVRLSDGLVRLVPRLAGRPVGRAAGQRLKLGLPVTVANEADLGALAEHRRGVAVEPRRRPVPVRRGGCRRRPDRRRQPDRRGRLCRGGRPHAG